MIIGQLSEVIWVFYQDGRVQSTHQNLKKEDILQYAKMALSNMLRQLYYSNKRLQDGDEYYASAPLLSVINFKLSEEKHGKRRVDMSEFDLYRLPKNSHIVSIFPVGCSERQTSLSQVQPGEEYFYQSPTFKDFQYYVEKGRGVDVYNLPECINSVDIESTFDTDEIDVSLDVAFDVANQVLGVTLRIPEFMGKDVDNSFSPSQRLLKQRIAPQEESTI